jgi:predicted nucleic acid-binding protein
MKAIADTGFLVAFGNRHDYHHVWAVAIAEAVTEPLVTCEAVLAETAFHLGSSALVLALLHDGLVRFPDWRSWPRATRIASRILRIFA